MVDYQSILKDEGGVFLFSDVDGNIAVCSSGFGNLRHRIGNKLLPIVSCMRRFRKECAGASSLAMAGRRFVTGMEERWRDHQVSKGKSPVKKLSNDAINFIHERWGLAITSSPVSLAKKSLSQAGVGKNLSMEEGSVSRIISFDDIKNMTKSSPQFYARATKIFLGRIQREGGDLSWVDDIHTIIATDDNIHYLKGAKEAQQELKKLFPNLTSVIAAHNREVSGCIRKEDHIDISFNGFNALAHGEFDVIHPEKKNSLQKEAVSMATV